MPHRDASTHLPRRSSRCNRPASRPGGSWRWLGTCTGRQALAACSVLLSSQPPWAFSIATTYNNHNNDKINNEDIIKEGRSRNHSLLCLVPLSTLLQLPVPNLLLLLIFVLADMPSARAGAAARARAIIKNKSNIKNNCKSKIMMRNKSTEARTRVHSSTHALMLSTPQAELAKRLVHHQYVEH